MLITLSLILAGLAAFFYWRNQSAYSDISAEKAKRDIQNGNIMVLTAGLLANTSQDDEIKSLQKEYGFKSCTIGCNVDDDILKDLREYNYVVENYLDTRNGKGWKSEYQSKLDSLYKISAMNSDKSK